MVQTNNGIPLYAEEIKIEKSTAKQVIQEILNKFKQPIPNGFVKLNVEEGNYQFSTSSKWKDKPLSERYGFDYQGEWKQIDIPHELMEVLELNRGEDITYPLYLSSKVLERQPTRGAITIENEEEIFIDKPVSEKGAERELMKRLKELENLRKNNQASQEIIIDLQSKINSLEEKLERYENELADKKNEIDEWKNVFFNCQNVQQAKTMLDNLNSQLTDANSHASNLQTQLNAISVQISNLNNELAKEKGWWSKWINDGKIFINYDILSSGELGNITVFSPTESEGIGILAEDLNEVGIWKKTKIFVKENIYQYYRDK